MKKKIVLCAIVLVLSLPGFIITAAADTLYLKNGNTIQGFIKKETLDAVELDVGFGTMKFGLDQIAHIHKSSPEEAQALREKWESQRRAMAAEAAAKTQDLPSAEKPQPKDVQVDTQAGHIMVDTLLNHKVKAQLLLDTGASILVLTHGIAEKLGLQAKNYKQLVELKLADGRKIKAIYITLDNVSVQGVEAGKVPVAVFTEEIADLGYKDGLLGMSFLNRFNFKVDQKNKKLILERLE